MTPTLLAGTTKGLIILHAVNNQWKIAAVQFEGLSVSMVYVDERNSTWWVALSHRHWGEKLHYSRDRGMNWEAASNPSYQDYFYRPNQPASLRRIWAMHHAGADKPDTLWLGTEPGGLFLTTDNGQSWKLCEGLWNHPSRLDDKQWFGAGKDFPFIHSIVVDPRDSNHVYIGVSCAGIFETRDGGQTWRAKNKGLIAAYLPNPNAELGHDPHKVLLCATRPDVIWQQNHCGIFRTVDAGENWRLVSGENGFPNYGFALAIDEQNPETAWVIPAQSDEKRIPVSLKLTVCKTTDGGQHWAEESDGLPDTFSFDLVLRHAFVNQGSLLAFGSNNGNLYVSDVNEKKWRRAAQNLASVNCLIAVK
jgi:photosystem II stability/assembly factor-like uncharacterized protein